MRYGRYGWPYLWLSWGLGIVFLWIGIDIIRHPTDWIGYLPTTLPLGLSRELALRLNGFFDVILGTFLLLRWFPRITSLFAILHLTGIIVTQGIDAVLIRDVGLLGMSLALFFWPQHNHRKRWWQKLFGRRSSGGEDD